VGFPIRKFSDQSLFAAPQDLSQRTTSFIASQRQGIHQIPLRHLIVLITKERFGVNAVDKPRHKRALVEKTSFASNTSGSLAVKRGPRLRCSSGLSEQKPWPSPPRGALRSPSPPAFRPNVFPLHDVRYRFRLGQAQNVASRSDADLPEDKPLGISTSKRNRFASDPRDGAG
jgi:hypothetical protein